MTRRKVSAEINALSTLIFVAVVVVLIVKQTIENKAAKGQALTGGKDNMESRKIFSAVLSALLMTGAFTGCGSAKKEESDDEETSAQTLTVSDPVTTRASRERGSR